MSRALLCLTAAAAVIAAPIRADSNRAAEVIGRMLFSDSRFTSPQVVPRVGAASEVPVSCRSCHLLPDPGAASETTHLFCDTTPRSHIPAREDGLRSTLRNSPSLIEAIPADGTGFLHWDGEFVSAEALVSATFLGRNFGWLPGEREAAERHFANIIRADTGPPSLGGRAMGYAVLFAGVSPAIPTELRLPANRRFDASRASDHEIVMAGSAFVADYLRTLRLARDEHRWFEGTPYDAFLAANHLSQAPAPGETDHEYTRRIAEQVTALRHPHFIVASATTGRRRFGPLELQGMKIFLRAALGPNQVDGAGNCAECHTPPRFTDGRFHNTGAAQQEFDAKHGRGRFLMLTIPTLTERNLDYDHWLPPTFQHPHASSRMASPSASDDPTRADLGLWNVYANTDIPAPQRALEQLLNPDAELTADRVLATTIASFKTASLRNVADSSPYLHTGAAQSLSDVVRFYQSMSDAARTDTMRNPPPEFFLMRLGSGDIAPLVAFMTALSGGLPAVGIVK